MFWIPAVLIFLFEGVMPAFTFNSELAKEGIRALGYPEYFGYMLVVFKVLGSLLLVIPAVPKRFKEWVFAGFTFDFICAFVSIVVVSGGFVSAALLPVVALVVLAVAYFGYHKMNPDAVQTI